MSYIPPLDESKPRKRLPRALDEVEIRILGSLMEKQMATPEYYPLTLNALVAAANQKTNREPVTDLGEDEVERALGRLQDEKLVWKVMGGRAVRYDHNIDRLWHVNTAEKAILTLLLLRGAQTAGELRGRSDRLHSFGSVSEVEETLRALSDHSEPLAVRLGRRPGQKEERWSHLVGGAPVDDAPEPAEDRRSAAEPMSARVARLEEQVAALSAELRALKEKLGE